MSAQIPRRKRPGDDLPPGLLRMDEILPRLLAKLGLPQGHADEHVAPPAEPWLADEFAGMADAGRQLVAT